ncbi:hypothetical protein [Actinomadura litoris]|uniref:Uncharacterized protein n=1 Tax=Actinomadura litoris TaxID=2678616 RepID=A0A7K1L588_9ACTN|nr:hypothetical protein [Actinomadura litoris]MUN39594.1 hypothetical protein [Actinomadura litoris]
MDVEPGFWWVRRWAAPVVLAVLVAASVGGVALRVERGSYGGERAPLFMVTVGRVNVESAVRGSGPWVRVDAFTADHRTRVADVERPPPSTGAAREIIAGPGGAFVAASSSGCETRLHRFRLTRAGHVTGLEPVRGGAVPGLVAGLAMSPDGRRLAFASAACGARPRPADPPRSALTVLDLGSGRRRTWGASGGTVLGEIIWAADSRTVGYTLGDVGGKREEARYGQVGTVIEHATVRALDTGAGGADLRAGRVLFRAPDGSRLTGAVMRPDGRTGDGTMRRGAPPATAHFTFAEGRGMRVTWTESPERGFTLTFRSALRDPPPHACLGGVDPFGRVVDGLYLADWGAPLSCASASSAQH